MKSMFKFISIFLLTIVLIILSINLTYSIKYFPADGIFDIKNLDYSYDLEYTGKIKFDIELDYKEQSLYYIEVLSVEENLIVAQTEKTCKNSCDIKVGFDKTFFGKYKLIVTTNHNGRFYQKTIPFLLELEKPKYEITLPPFIYLDPNNGLNIKGHISSNYKDQIEYSFEIYPKTAYENKKSFKLDCTQSCDFNFNIDEKILIDEYLINIYSELGEQQKRFQVKLPYVGETNSNQEEIQNFEDQMKFNEYFSESSKLPLEEYFLTNNLEKEPYQTKINLIDQFTKTQKSKSQISLFQMINLELEFSNTNLKNIFIENTKIGQTELKIQIQNISSIETQTKLKNITSAFLIHTNFSKEISQYELTYLATGNQLYICQNYNLKKNKCNSKYIKSLETKIGSSYTIINPSITSQFIELKTINSQEILENQNLDQTKTNLNITQKQFQLKTKSKPITTSDPNKLPMGDKLLQLYLETQKVFDKNENEYYYQKLDYNEIKELYRKQEQVEFETKPKIIDSPATITLGEEFEFELEINKNQNLEDIKLPENSEIIESGIITKSLNFLSTKILNENTKTIDVKTIAKSSSGEIEIKDKNGKTLDTIKLKIEKNKETINLENKLNIEIIELENLNAEKTQSNIKIQKENTNIKFENLLIENLEKIEIIQKEKLSQTDLTLKNTTLSSDILHVEANNFQTAEVTLEKTTKVENILTCQFFENEECISGWENANIEFKQNETHVYFNVTHFSAYVAQGSGFEFSVEFTDLTQKSVFQNETTTVNLQVTCTTGNCGVIDVSLLTKDLFQNYEFYEVTGTNYNEFGCTENPTSGDDDSTRTYQLGFDFPFYGSTILGTDNVLLDTNGRLGLGTISSDYSPTVAEFTSNKIIANIWTDLGDGTQNNEYTCLNKGAGTKYSSFRFDSTWYNNAGTSQSEIILFENGNIKINHGTLATKADVYTGISNGDDTNNDYFTTDATDYSDKSYMYYYNDGILIPNSLSSNRFHTPSLQNQQISLNLGESQIVSFTINGSGTFGTDEIFARAKSNTNDGIRAQSSDLDVTIKDQVPPFGSLTSPINNFDGTSNDKTITFKATAQDDSGVQSATLYVWNSTGNIIQSLTKSISGTSENVEWNVTFNKSDQYTWNVEIEDISLTKVWANSSDWNLKINIPTLNIKYLTNPQNLEIVQNSQKEITLQVTCEGNSCGTINLSLNTLSSSSLFDDFEIDFGNWVNVAGDDADWARKSGVSGSGGTGPYLAGDLTSSSSGANYIYTEASNPNSPSKYFHVESIALDINSDMNFNFWYHMYGAGMGTLTLEVYEDNIWKNIWSQTGDKGQVWYNGNINYTPMGQITKVRYNALTGSSYQSDMVLDDINLSYLIQTQFPTTPISTPFYVNNSNLIQIPNMQNGETRNITFLLTATGAINETQNYLVDVSSNNYSYLNTQTNTHELKVVELQIEEINISIAQPTTPTVDVYRGGQFDLVYNVTCESNKDCNNINLSLQYEGLETIGESGSLKFQNNEQKIIKFKKKYSQTPLIYAVPTTDNLNDNNPLVPIIHQINKTHATISLCEDAGQTTCETTVEEEELNYFIFDIDKSNQYPWIEIGTVPNKLSDGITSSFNFGKTFTNAPYLFTQSQTYQSASNQIGTHTWTKTITTSSSELFACDHPGTGDVCAGTFTDTIAYLAIDTVLAEIIGLNAGVQAIGASTWTPIVFTESYTDPTILVAQNSEVGAQDPQYPWAKSLTPTGSEIRYCEADGIGDCDSHSAETIVWLSLENGIIQVDDLKKLNISTIQNEVPIYIKSPITNPTTFNLSAGQKTQFSFPLYFTGNDLSTYKISPTISYSNQTPSFNATILESNYIINITTPKNGQAVIINDTFQITANLSCTGYCGELTATARENNIQITNSSANTIYTLFENPQTCMPLIDGSCEFTWISNVNDIVGNTYDLDILITSNILDQKDSDNVIITIVGGPEVKFLADNLSITGAIANYQEKSKSTEILALIADQTNLSVSCVTGDCNFITSNFVDNSPINTTTNLDITFTCLPDSAGSYSALFNLTSYQDQIPNSINVTCDSTELDLYVNLINPIPENKYDIEQNKSFNLDFNITCNTIGGCSNTELGIYYLRDSIGETGEVNLQNYETKAISFENEYAQIPVVLAIPVTDNLDDNNALVPVITEITQSGFNIKLCEDAGQTTCDPNTELESVNYYVFDIAKTNVNPWIEVGYMTNIISDGTDTPLTFSKTFTNTPYLFATAQTNSDALGAIAPHTWAHTVTTTTAQVIACDHPGVADACAGATTETYAYLAIDVANAEIGELSSGSSSISNSEWTDISFANNYQNPMLLVSQNSDTGSQDPQYPWAKNLAFNSAQIRYCEQDDIGDCDSHSAEVVVWLALQKGPIYLGLADNNKVSTTPGQTPYYTTNLNPQTLNLAEGTITTVSFTLNATGQIGNITDIYGLLHNGIGSKTLPIRTIGKNHLLFNKTYLNFTQIYENELPGIEPNKLSSRYQNDNVSISCISGDCLAFSTSWTNGNTILEDQIEDINFICSDETVGDFSAIFQVTSDNSLISNQVSLDCNVKEKNLDIDFHTPNPNTHQNLTIYQTMDLTFNVTCKTIGGCNNVEVTAEYKDDTLVWWNNSWNYKQDISIVSTVNALPGYTVLVQLNKTNVGPKFDWANSCDDLRFIQSSINELNYWVESCDLLTQTANIWVKANQGLSTLQTYNFEMYYNNPTAISNSNPASTFNQDEIFLVAGRCPNTDSNCNPMDNEAEVNTIRSSIGTGSFTIDGQGYVTEINHQANPYSATQSDYYLRFRALYIPQTSGIYSFGTSSDDGSQAIITNYDLYGPGLNSAPTTNNLGEVITSWYGAHGADTCGNNAGIETSKSLNQNQGYWIDYVMNEIGGDDDAQFCIDSGSGYQNFNIVNFPGQIYSRAYVTVEPIANIGQHYDQYTLIPTTNTGLSFWTENSNGQTINLLNNEIKQVTFLINSSTPYSNTYKLVGILSNGDHTNFINLSITNLQTEIDLSLQLNKSKIILNEYSAEITFKNIAKYNTPRNKSLVVYIYQSNQIILTSPIQTSISQNFNTLQINENLNTEIYNGTIYKFILSPKQTTNYQTVFEPHTIIPTYDNSFQINFNYSQNKTSDKPTLLAGFDPIKTNILENTTNQITIKNSINAENGYSNFKNIFTWLIQIFINLAK